MRRRKSDGGAIDHIDHSHGICRGLMGNEGVTVWSRTGRVVVGLGVVVVSIIVSILVLGRRIGWTGILCSSQFLCSDFFSCEKTSTRAPGTSHGMFVTRFVKIRLALTREAMYLFKTSAGYSALEDAEVLFCIDV